MKNLLILSILVCIHYTASSQFLMDMIDTTKDLGRGLLDISRKYDHITISGYMQPQYQVATSKGAAGNAFEGGSFGPYTDNRFRLRRGRIRFDYARFTVDSMPRLQFVFQFDGTEQGVNIRDFWGRVWESKWNKFSLTTGVFARPFGWEVNYSSSDREVPERGRMSQLLLKTERDLGAMVTLLDRSKQAGFLKKIRVDFGIFNGQGLAAPAEVDSRKDFIGQIVLNPQKLSHSLTFSGGVSYLHGGIVQTHTSRYKFDAAQKAMVESLTEGKGSYVPRRYSGANAQVQIRNVFGKTQLRGEWWWGIQPGLANSSETAHLSQDLPIYQRNFHGGFFYFLQDLGTPKTQLVLKYDYYNPNVDAGTEILQPAAHFTTADIAYHTYGAGILQHLTPNLKLFLFYSKPVNREIPGMGIEKDMDDEIATCRLQFRF